MFQICFCLNPSQDLVFEISKIIQNFDHNYISGLVLPCTQNRHLNFNSTHCAPHHLNSPLTRPLWDISIFYVLHLLTSKVDQISEHYNCYIIAMSTILLYLVFLLFFSCVTWKIIISLKRKIPFLTKRAHCYFTRLNPRKMGPF